mgnify:CR=1 FL=1
MDHFHTRTHKLKGNISPDIQENIKYTTQIMQDCNDLVQKQFKIGIDHEISIYIVYMDGLVNTEMLQESMIAGSEQYHTALEYFELLCHCFLTKFFPQ